MIIIQMPTYPDSTSPCGCLACDKWSDCDFCEACSGAYLDPEWIERQTAYHAERDVESSFGDWLFGDDDDED